MAYKVVIFDLDGTLLDTLTDLGEAVNHALALRGLPLHERAAYRLMVGHGVRNLVTQALPPEYRQDDAFIDACLSDFKDYYTAHIDVHTRPYDGMPQLLAELSGLGISLAVASNKFQAGTEALIREFFPGIPFVSILGNREGYPLKPDPEIVREVLRKVDQPASSAVLVGDSPTDMKTALNGSIRGIAVRWGYRDMPPCAKPGVAAAAGSAVAAGSDGGGGAIVAAGSTVATGSAVATGSDGGGGAIATGASEGAIAVAGATAAAIAATGNTAATAAPGTYASVANPAELRTLLLG